MAIFQSNGSEHVFYELDKNAVLKVEFNGQSGGSFITLKKGEKYKERLNLPFPTKLPEVTEVTSDGKALHVVDTVKAVKMKLGM